LRASLAGRSLDRRLVESAALLHDIDKLEMVKPQVAGLTHGEGSAAWLAGRGYAELGPVIVGHPVTRLADGEWFGRWFASASPEALIVAYADKRAGQRLESMAERFASWERRYPPAERAAKARGAWTVETVAQVRDRSAEIERRVCEMAAVEPGEVRRLEWTGAAIAAARLNAPGLGAAAATAGAATATPGATPAAAPAAGPRR
jgi:hypothetical protein